MTPTPEREGEGRWTLTEWIKAIIGLSMLAWCIINLVLEALK